MIIVVKSYGLGDTICSTPTIRKIAKEVNTKIKMISYFPEVFTNLPYVSESIDLKTIPNGDNIHLSDENINCVIYSEEKQMMLDMMHTMIDIRQYASIQCGFQLLNEEMDCDYIPTETFDINTPDEYIVVHPTTSWPIKTWDVNKWQELCDNIDLPVISIGKNENRRDWSYKCNKLNNVIDLTDQTSLDQTWHLLNNAKYIITADSGILHLAGTTDTDIVYIAMGKHHQLLAPYRHQSQDYKMHIISNCNWCLSNLNCYKKSLLNCIFNKTNETCQPSVDQVLEVING